jgi:hypothetical protein
MENVTANKALLYENIEGGLTAAEMLIDVCEKNDVYLPEFRTTLGKALTSLELLRADLVEDCSRDVRTPVGER